MRCLLAILILSLSQGVAAQHGFQEGFLLSHRLDTTRGLIRFSGEAEVPKPCLFKSSKKDAVQEIFPGTVHGFCTDKGAYYYSRSIGRSHDVFLEVLVKGYVSLFKFGGMFFIEKGDSAFFELSDEREVMVVEGQQQLQKSYNYARMLALVMSDCPEVSKKISSTPLKDRPLVSLVTAYNRCKGSPSELFRVKSKSGDKRLRSTKPSRSSP